MRMIRPKLEAETIVVAENQGEYKPITAALVKHPDFPGARGLPYNTLVTAHVLTDEEREALLRGEPLYVCLLTMLEPMQPVICVIGSQAAANIYGVEVEQ